MKVFLTSAYPYHSQLNFMVVWLHESFATDPFKIHTVCKCPEEADIILFAEHHPNYDPYFFRVLGSSLYKKFKNKCYLYHDNDKVLPLLPGVFPSIERKYYHPYITQSGPYIARLCVNGGVTLAAKNVKKCYLFSFVGAACTHKVRKELFSLICDDVYLEDTSGIHSWELNEANKREYEGRYTRIIQSSQFVLCPRGIGPNTYRLYEAMELGVAPVIISDEWIPMSGPDWASFSIKISENDIQNIPSILKKREGDAEKLGKNARLAWEKWFSKEVSFHHITEACKKLHDNRNKVNRLHWLKMYGHFLEPYHLRCLLRVTKKRLLKS